MRVKMSLKVHLMVTQTLWTQSAKLFDAPFYFFFKEKKLG